MFIFDNILPYLKLSMKTVVYPKRNTCSSISLLKLFLLIFRLYSAQISLQNCHFPNSFVVTCYNRQFCLYFVTIFFIGVASTYLLMD